MEKRFENARSSQSEPAKKPTFGETQDEFRKRLGRIEMHLIDLRNHLLPKKEKTRE